MTQLDQQTTASTRLASVSLSEHNGAYYKALTVKLDRARYEALKAAGIKLDKKSQEILVAALDNYLSMAEELRAS